MTLWPLHYSCIPRCNPPHRLTSTVACKPGETQTTTKVLSRLRLKCDGTRAETRFRLSAKRTSPFKSVGRQFSRLLAVEVCASAVVMQDTPCSEAVWRVLATQSIRQFPFHFPSRASPCAITFQLDSTTFRNIPSAGGLWTHRLWQGHFYYSGTLSENNCYPFYMFFVPHINHMYIFLKCST